MVGDDKQLPPVGAGNFFSDAIQLDAVSKAELTDIRRQAETPELLEAVKEAVSGDPSNSLRILAKEDAIHEIKTAKGRTSAIVREYMGMSDAERAGTLILSAKNADRIDINNAIRGELVKAGKIEQGKEYAVEVKKDEPPQIRNFAKGDKIVFLRNDIKNGVRNGTQGTIQEIKGDNFRVNIGTAKEPKIVNIDIKKYNYMDHAYCVTTHKAQGATVQRVIVNMNSADTKLNSRNSYYVDISRAKSKVSLYCDSRAKCGEQVQNFARKITGKDVAFSKPATTAAPIRATGTAAAVKPTAAARPVAEAGKAAGKAVESVAALVPPIPIIKPILQAAAKAASIAAQAVEIAIKPVETAAGLVKSAAETGIKAGNPQKAEGMEQAKVRTLQPDS